MVTTREAVVVGVRISIPIEYEENVSNFKRWPSHFVKGGFIMALLYCGMAGKEQCFYIL